MSKVTIFVVFLFYNGCFLNAEYLRSGNETHPNGTTTEKPTTTSTTTTSSTTTTTSTTTTSTTTTTTTKPPAPYTLFTLFANPNCNGNVIKTITCDNQCYQINSWVWSMIASTEHSEKYDFYLYNFLNCQDPPGGTNLGAQTGACGSFENQSFYINSVRCTDSS